MLDKYKSYRTIYKATIVRSNGSSFVTKARLMQNFRMASINLSDDRALNDYRAYLNNKGCIILSFYAYQVPSLLTRVINIMELIRNIFIRRQ